MALENDFFRKVMGQFATGVTIATTRRQAELAGLTVNSFTSISLNPLLVLICVDLRSQTLPFFRESGVFAVNILAQEQEELSSCFATSSEKRYTYFCHAEHYFAATGAPILAGTLGFLDTRITAEYPGGDHVIFVGQVEAMGYDGQVLFLHDAPTDQDLLADLARATSATSNNGHTGTGNQHNPLLYFRGQYHHVANHHHEQAEVRSAQIQHE